MDRAGLIREVEEGLQPDYMLFWGHRQKRDGIVDPSCLSQWFPIAFEVAGERYATAEHWMMASKASLFADAAMRRRILKTTDPGEAKALGRKVRGFDDARWAAARYEIVVEGSVHKFASHPKLRDFLLATGDRVLVEASPRDRIWGIGLGRNNTDATNPSRWRGQNLLGFALMEARARLRT